jgi:hypothetical protein
MKSIMLTFFLSASGAWAADEAADRAAIEKTVAGLSSFPMREDLFTADFDGREELRSLQRVSAPVVCPEVWGELCSPVGVTLQTTIDNQPWEVIISKDVWGEATIALPGSVVGMRGAITAKEIRFLTPGVAMVDAMGRHPVLILWKKEGTDWKIASLRILAKK